MSEKLKASDGSFSQQLGRFLRFLVRLTFVVVVGALLGVGLYYGVPHLYRSLVLPVREHSARIAALENRVGQQQERISENHRALQDRVAELETNLTELHEELAIQSQAQQALQEQSQQLDERIMEVQGALEGQEQEIAELESALGEVSSDLGERIGTIDDRLQGQMEDTESRVADLETQGDMLMGRLTLLQTAQGLSKVRLLLLEENTGAARDTLELAIARLDQARALMPAYAEDLEMVRERMVTLDDLIAERSFRVRPNLESLWNDLMDLAGPLSADAEVAVTQTDSPLATPTPSP